MLQAIDRTAGRFMQVLNEAEQTGNLDALVDLFAEGAELHNLVQDAPYKGREGVRKFWEAYLSAFRKVHTDFLHAVEGRGDIALEWRAEGVLLSSDSIEFRGITVLELEEGLIKSLRTYYDTAAFVRASAAT